MLFHREIITNGNQVAIYLTGNKVNIITVVIENSFKISQF